MYPTIIEVNRITTMAINQTIIHIPKSTIGRNTKSRIHISIKSAILSNVAPKADAMLNFLAIQPSSTSLTQQIP